MAAVSRESDADLAARCAAGDRGAQRELFLRTRTAVHRTLFRVLGSNQDVEDLLQDAFLAMFRSVGNYAGRSSLLTWCCSVASHVALSHLRRRKAIPTADLELESDAPSADRVMRARLALARLYRVLDRVDPVQRIAFALAVIDGRPLAEVAELTGASVTAVKTQVWRARKALDKRAAADPLLREYMTELVDGAAEEAG
ncbi:MAG: RNA polymerase sigma factor [Myxococcales bacterium]|nr:RNA polymerase sigma factor [Myxococcales bacterium]